MEKQSDQNPKVKFPKNWQEFIKNGGSFDFYFKFKDGRLIKKKITAKNKEEKLSGACGGPKGIKIDKLFFEFSYKEKVALLWHELYHCRKSYIPKILWLEIKYAFGDKESIWEEEYNADKYSALQNNPKDCLSFLKVVKELYKRDKTLYKHKTHPPIQERIKQIRKLVDVISLSPSTTPK